MFTSKFYMEKTHAFVTYFMSAFASKKNIKKYYQKLLICTSNQICGLLICYIIDKFTFFGK